MILNRDNTKASSTHLGRRGLWLLEEYAMAPDPPRLTVTASGRASLNRSARPAALSPPAAPGCRSPSGLSATAGSNTASISAARPPPKAAMRSARRPRSPLPRTLPLPRAASLPIATSVSIGMTTTGGVVAGLYCGGACVRACARGEGGRRIGTDPHGAAGPPAQLSWPVTGRRALVGRGEDKDKRVNSNSLFLLGLV